MNKYEFIKELKERGFKFNSKKEHSYDYEFSFYNKEDIEVMFSNCYGVDLENDMLIPYRLYLNFKIVVGHKRCLNYIDKLLRSE